MDNNPPPASADVERWFVLRGLPRFVEPKTDDTYRSEFADDVGPEIREALAVRAAYRVARDTNETRELT